MKRRLLPVVVLLSGAVLAAAVILCRGLLSAAGAGGPRAPGLLESDLEAESRELD